jgi:hypothetical protein|tara:strand:- start:166 stop:765 length:600 start_codon:yes stop_codon:yes gene_type:complete
MLKVLSISLLLCCSLPFQGQTPGIILENPLNSEESTLNSQHKFIMEQSRTYVNNKVVKIEWIEKFYSNVKDSLESAKYESSNFEKAYSEEIKLSKDALTSVTALKKELASVNFEKENITLFGSLTSKSSYKTIVWIIIISLFSLLLFFLFKFKSSNRLTKDAKEKLKEIEFELEETKKKSRIKEQELMRKLQDEINKNS